MSDDSFCFWTVEGKIYYGQVGFFCTVRDWEETIAIVNRYKVVRQDGDKRLVVEDDLTTMTTIKADEIGGLVGRIQKLHNGKMTWFLMVHGSVLV